METSLEGSCSEERRANVRLSRVLAVALEIGDEFRNCVAVDLSVSGFQVAAPFKLDAGRVIPVKLHLAKHRPVKATAQVVWCQEMDLSLFRLGFQIEQVSSKKDFERLCRYVDKELLNVKGLPKHHDSALELSTQVTLRTMSQAELDRFAALARISEMLNGSQSLEELLDRALKVVVEATGAERGMMLLDRGGPELEVPVFHAKTANESRAFSRSVVDRVLTSQQPLLSLDAQRDERLSSSSSLKVMGTRSILCVPIQARNRSYGTLYLDNSVRAGALNQSDLKLATVLCAMAASAIERAEDFAQLVQSEKLATIGTLTASFLHELTNPLSAILNIGEMLHEDVGGELTELLLQEAERCGRLAADLLRLSRKQPVEMSSVEIEGVLATASNAVKTDLRRRNILLEIHLKEKLPPVRGNPDHLRQVVLNLLTNAIQATEGVPNAKVEIRAKARPDDLLLIVADNGSGIPPRNLAKIFDPFFSTKTDGKGTGLGLSIIARIINEHGGTIRAENRPQGGALFQVTLPLAEPQNQKSSA